MNHFPTMRIGHGLRDETKEFDPLSKGKLVTLLRKKLIETNTRMIQAKHQSMTEVGGRKRLSPEDIGMIEAIENLIFSL